MSITLSSPARIAALTAFLLCGGISTLSAPVQAQQAPPPPPPPPPEANPPTAPTTPVPPSTPGTPTPPEEASPGTPPAPPEASGGSAPTPSSGGRTLLLPDISLNGILLGHLSTDKRDQTRDKLRLQEAELAIQGFVYPDIRLDTFTVFSSEGANVEEAYLTVQNVPYVHLPLSAVLGRRKVPIGRVNQLHPHSWLYAVQPYVLTNLVSNESLTGDGAYVSYLLPTGKLFAQLDAGFWSQSEVAESLTPANDPTVGIVTSPGAGFADKFTTLRLQTATSAMGGDIEASGSLVLGRGLSYTTANSVSVRPQTMLSGLSLTYRRAGRGASHLLLRSEYYEHSQKDGSFRNSTDGYYFFANQQLDDFTSLGLRYDRSGFPFAPGLHEDGISLIGTRSLTEATYLRGQINQGNRPGKRNFTEVFLQIVFGVGPHTHNLE